MPSPDRFMKFHFITLGCPKNRVDSEVMFGSLLQHEYEYTDDPAQAELIVVNSCSFIESAKTESINTILEMASYKQEGSLKKLVVSGCLAQRYQKEVEAQFPEVDHFIGTGEYYKIASILESQQRGNYSIPSYIHTYSAPRLNSMPFYTAYLKLTEGCNRQCGFCIIPKIRGRQKSQTIENLAEEARRLVSNGVTELNLIGQDLTSYGTDLNDSASNLLNLLKELVKIKDLKWIRLLYCYPDKISEEFLEFLASQEKVCNYIDLPLQHIDPIILKSMKRGVTQKLILKTLDRIRSKVPNLTLRTSFIVGYPGETDLQFQTLYNFVKDQKFDHVGVFTYSHEENTYSYDLKSQIKESVKIQRKDKLMMLQAEIAKEKKKAFVGKDLEVLIEGWDPKVGRIRARYEGQAPDIDGNVFIEEAKENPSFQPGKYVSIRILRSLTYDLIGKVVH